MRSGGSRDDPEGSEGICCEDYGQLPRACPASNRISMPSPIIWPTSIRADSRRAGSIFRISCIRTCVLPGRQRPPAGQLPSGIQVGMGAKVVSVEKLFSQGDFSQTKNQLDIAIQGKGFFKLTENGRDVFTRSGAFKVDKNGFVCDSNGNRLQPRICHPCQRLSSITLDSGGKLVASGSDGKELGSTQIQLYDFANSAGLQSIGQNLLFRATAPEIPSRETRGRTNLEPFSRGFLKCRTSMWWKR